MIIHFIKDKSMFVKHIMGVVVFFLPFCNMLKGKVRLPNNAAIFSENVRKTSIKVQNMLHKFLD